MLWVLALLLLLIAVHPPRLRFAPLGPSWCPRLAEPVSFTGPLLKSVFKGAPKPKKAPAFVPPPVMPVTDDEAVLRAKRRAAMDMQNRSGRLSTVLTDTQEQTLG
jgi:hypothetical protein